MSLDVVKVTVAADVSPDDVAVAEGNVVCIPSGSQWPDTNSEPIVPMVVHGYLGTTGSCVVDLVASDNFTAGVLNWTFVINIRGFPTVNYTAAVNFADGAEQSVWDILDTAGWTP